jgi:hypothetical protein
MCCHRTDNKRITNIKVIKIRIAVPNVMEVMNVMFAIRGTANELIILPDSCHCDTESVIASPEYRMGNLHKKNWNGSGESAHQRWLPKGTE